MHDVRAELGRVRHEAGKSQREIAETLGLAAFDHVSRIERGIATTTIDKAAIWADSCGYDLVLVSRTAPGVAELAAELAVITEGERAIARKLIRLMPRLSLEGSRMVARYIDAIAADYEEEERKRETAK
jgi:transcriptional regulator with XRE-family HTH domain